MACDVRSSFQGSQNESIMGSKRVINNNRMSKRAATTVPPLMVFLSLVLLLATPAQASIHFLDSGKAFPSRPDPHFGQPLLRGYDYMGRIQTIPENPTLCDYNRKDKYNIVAPKDGIPGTLFF